MARDGTYDNNNSMIIAYAIPIGV